MAEKQMTSIEEKLSELERLTVMLEEGKLPIDEAITVYSRGMELAVSCKQSLDSLSQRIQIAKKNANEAVSLENFEPQGSNTDF